MEKRHYEIVFIAHSQAEDGIKTILSDIHKVVTENGGAVHRSEDWGLRELSYRIQNISRAYYGLVNIECQSDTVDIISKNFRYDSSVLRSLVLKREKAITEPTGFLKKEEREDSSTEGEPPIQEPEVQIA